VSRNEVDLVAFSYSDVRHVDVMHTASLVMARGADFMLIGATYTMLTAGKPVVSVCAVRTGCGKSQTTRKVCEILHERGLKAVVVRHPMPYGDLGEQIVQRFSTYEDFNRQSCTIEEREEYEPLVDRGIVVYAGVDYGKILARAEAEADVIVWDGGNNDTPFYRPDIHVVLFDPLRPGHELLYYPGEANLIMADIAVINKVSSAGIAQIEQVRKNILSRNTQADIILADSSLLVSDPSAIRGKRVLVVEDGPTLTHGGMPYGAGKRAAEVYGAEQVVDPRASARGSIAETFRAYPHIDAVLPAMGYTRDQVRDLEKTINDADCDLVLFATPIQITRLLTLDKPALRVRYEYTDHGEPVLAGVLARRLEKIVK
jgi:predicted GTPase